MIIVSCFVFFFRFFSFLSLTFSLVCFTYRFRKSATLRRVLNYPISLDLSTSVALSPLTTFRPRPSSKWFVSLDGSTFLLSLLKETTEKRFLQTYIWFYSLKSNDYSFKNKTCRECSLRPKLEIPASLFIIFLYRKISIEINWSFIFVV